MLFDLDLQKPEGWDPDLLDWVSYNNPIPSKQTQATDYLSQTSMELPLPLYYTQPSTSTTISDTSTTTSTAPSITPSSDTSTYKFNGSQKDFINTMRSLYRKGIEEYNKTHADQIDLKYVDDLVAHDAIESGYGKHPSGTNNYGGIKVTDKQASQGIPYKLKKTFEYINGKKVTIYSKFRSFSSLKDYIKFKLQFLTSGRYAKAGVFHSSDSFASQLKRAGYYTAPVSQYEAILNKVKRSMKNG